MTHWQGDVATGVSAWLGDDERPSSHHEDGNRGPVRGDPVPEDHFGGPQDPPPDSPPDLKSLGPDADPESVARTILLDQLTGRARTRRDIALPVGHCSLLGHLVS